MVEEVCVVVEGILVVFKDMHRTSASLMRWRTESSGTSFAVREWSVEHALLRLHSLFPNDSSKRPVRPPTLSSHRSNTARRRPNSRMLHRDLQRRLRRLLSPSPTSTRSRRDYPRTFRNGRRSPQDLLHEKQLNLP